MILCHTIDEALAAHIRDTLPALRGLTPEDAIRHLIDDVDELRVALIVDA